MKKTKGLELLYKQRVSESSLDGISRFDKYFKANYKDCLIHRLSFKANYICEFTKKEGQ